MMFSLPNFFQAVSNMFFVKDLMILYYFTLLRCYPLQLVFDSHNVSITMTSL